MRPAGFEDFDYIDITATRQKSADRWANEGHRYEEDPERLRSLGWWYEDSGPACELCDLYDWDLPGTEVCEFCHQCGRCGHHDECLGKLCETLMGQVDEDLCEEISWKRLKTAHGTFPQYGQTYTPKLWSLENLGIAA